MAKDDQSSPPAPRTFAEFQERAKAGDRSLLPRLREALDGCPDLVRRLGDLGVSVRTALIDRTAGKDLLLRETQERRLSEMEHEIAGKTPTALEQLLAEQIVLCWQHLRLMELLHAHSTNGSTAQEEYYQRCIDRAQARYLAAIKALAQVRRLQLPSMQVNVAAEGGKQVNLLTPRTSIE